jgi:hypothetical protein
MITQGNILLAAATSAQIEQNLRPNLFVQNTSDKSMVFSPDGTEIDYYDERNTVNAKIASAVAGFSDQSLSTSATVKFAGIKISDSENIGALGNTNWLKVAEFANTGSSTPSKFHVQLIGGDWNDSAGATYDFTSHGMSTSASTLRIRRTNVFWKNTTSEMYYKVEWTCIYSSSLNRFEVYCRLANVDYCLLGADVTQQYGGTGVYKKYATEVASLPSTGYTTNPVIVDEQPVRQLSDALFLRNTSIIRDSQFQYTDTSAVSQIYFDGNRIVIPNRVYFNASTSGGSSVCIPQGSAPVSPNVGDVWFDSAYMYLQNTAGTRYLAITSGLSANYIPKSGSNGARLDNSSIIDDGVTVKIPSLSATTLVVGNIDNTEFNWLNGTSANIQTQLDTLSATKANASQLTSYLPLSGGTMTGPLVLNTTSLQFGNSYFSRTGDTSGVQLNINTPGTNAGLIPGTTSASQNAILGTAAYRWRSFYTQDAEITNAPVVSAYSGNKALISNGSKAITESSVTSTQLGYLSTTSADVQSQLSTLSATKSTNLFSIAANYDRTSTGNLTSGTIPGNTFSQTIPTKFEFLGSHSYNFTSGSSTISLTIAGTTLYTSTLIGSGSNKSNRLEIDAYVRHAGGSYFEITGMVKKYTNDGGTPSWSLDWIAGIFTATVGNPINFSWDTTITGTASANLAMAKVVKG